jgi:hypothetical protein
MAWSAIGPAGWSAFSVVLIVVNLVAVTLESVPDLAAQYGRWFERSREPVRAGCARHARPLDRRRRIAERIRGVVRHRIGRDIVSPQGDVVSEELQEIEGGEGS